MTRRLISWLATVLLCACASHPPAPQWQVNAHAALKSFSTAYLGGNGRLADFEFARARRELSSTGRVDMLARAELTRCAVRVASLELDDCAGYAPLAQDATAHEQAYAAYLSGRWTNMDPALLPAHHGALVRKVKAGQDSPQGPSPLTAMEDPLARLVATGVLLQTGQLSPSDIAQAVDTASAQGWRRPLLAWLGLQLQRAKDAGEQAAVARIQRRINLALQLVAPEGTR